MPKHLRTEIDNLKRKMLHVSALVEEQLQNAVKAIQTRDPLLAEAVCQRDAEVDRLEVELEEDCLKTLALHQPVAIDLRFIVAVLKINNDLERIGDLAVNVAERAKYLGTHERIEFPFDFSKMAGHAQTMLKRSIDALIEHDADLARSVGALDDEVDAINRAMYDLVKEKIRRHPEQLESLMNLISISRCIERVADHATNVSEDVVYMLEGDIIRHKGPS